MTKEMRRPIRDGLLPTLLLVGMGVRTMIAAPIVTAAPDKQTPIPRTVEESVAELRKTMSEEALNEIRRVSEADMVLFHHGLGTEIRNGWHLWDPSSPLAVSFYEMGVNEPDMMSGIILVSLWRDLHGLPLDVQTQVSAYLERRRAREAKEAERTQVSKDLLQKPLELLGGGTVRLADYGGKVVLLAWWEDIFEPSRDTLPFLRKLAKRHRGDGLEIIGVIEEWPERHPDSWLRKEKKYRPGFRSVWEIEDLAKELMPPYHSSPQMVLISRDGWVAGRFRGFDRETDPPVIETAVRKELAIR